ncbi:MAG TPA: DUF3365 domain-containing protein [Lacunisphaera sp.]|jgi:hypothetical protein|nr:DUF3365 domain-containing protein [Lacunisphaera sp.]
MKTLPMLLLVAFGSLAGRAAEPAVAGSTPFIWIALDDPAAATIRRNADEIIKRVGTTLIYEVEHSIQTDGLIKTLQIAHLRDFKMPRLPANQPQLTAIKLTSLQLRNPANAPDAADRAVLTKINDALQEGDDVPPQLIQLVTPTGKPPEWRVYRPVSTMPVCIKCHGPVDSLAPEVRSYLAEHYPADKAVDYSGYQWRGLIRVSFVESGKAK